MPIFNPPTGGGGGGATIPSTTNIIKGDGAGNGADSGIDSAKVAILQAAGSPGNLPQYGGDPNLQDSSILASDVSAGVGITNPIATGTGTFNLGNAETRTVLTGTATAPRAIALPNVDGIVTVQSVEVNVQTLVGWDSDGRIINTGIITADAGTGVIAGNAVKAVTGIVKSNGSTTIEAASAGTDFLAPGALPDGTTATTQPADDSTLIATTQFVNAAIAAVLSNAGTLATLMTAAGITPVADGTVTPVTSITTASGVVTGAA